MHIGKFLSPYIGIAGLLALAMSATLATAENHETIKIAVRTDGGIDDSLTLENLAVGATEVITTASGAQALITRSENGLTVELAGEVIEVALPTVETLHEHGEHNVFVLSDDEKILSHDTKGKVFVVKGNHDGEGKNHAIRKRVVIKRNGETGTEIEDIDIEAALEELNIELPEGAEGKRVIWIEKHVEVDEEQDEDH